MRKTIVINWVSTNGTVWHMDCEASKYESLMRLSEYHDDKTLMVCLACNKAGFYPVGVAGEVVVDEELSNDPS